MIDDIVFGSAKPEDFGYFYRLRQQAMLEHFKRAGIDWDEATELANHRKSFNIETLRMILFQGQLIGFVDVSPHGSDIRVSLFCIEPNRQGQGIGSEVMRLIINKADRRGQHIFLDVLKGNKASRLYERLGFARSEGDVDVLNYYKRVPNQEPRSGTPKFMSPHPTNE